MKNSLVSLHSSMQWENCLLAVECWDHRKSFAHIVQRDCEMKYFVYHRAKKYMKGKSRGTCRHSFHHRKYFQYYHAKGAKNQNKFVDISRIEKFLTICRLLFKLQKNVFANLRKLNSLLWGFEFEKKKHKI